MSENAANSNNWSAYVAGGQAITPKTEENSDALIRFDVSQHNNANGGANVTADGNIFGVTARVGGAFKMRWMLDAEGDTWQTGNLDLWNTDESINNAATVSNINFQGFVGDGSGAGSTTKTYGRIKVIADDVTGGTEDGHFLFTAMNAGNTGWADGRVGGTVATFSQTDNGYDASIMILAGAGRSSRIYFGDTADVDVGGIKYAHTDNSMSFQTNTATAMHITSDGKVVIGHTAGVDVGFSEDALEVIGTGLADSSMTLARFTSFLGNEANIKFLKSVSTTIGGSAIVRDNERLGQLLWYADDGNDYYTLGAAFGVEVDDSSPEENCVGTAFVWKQTLAGTTTPQAANNRETMRLDTLGRLLIGDNTIGTVDMDTAGLVINQAAGDKQILAFKSSDVVHGMTTVAETDTYGYIRKERSDNGGLHLTGLADTVMRGLLLEGIGTGYDTNKTYGSADAEVVLKAWRKNGTGTQVLGSNGNMVTIHDGVAGVRFIFDIEGDAYADVAWTTFDNYDDLALINDIEKELVASESSRGTEHRHMLEKTGIIGEDSWHIQDGRPRAMVNMTKLSMLHHGALMQAADKIKALEQKLLVIDELEKRLLAIEGAS